LQSTTTATTQRAIRSDHSRSLIAIDFPVDAEDMSEGYLVARLVKLPRPVERHKKFLHRIQELELKACN
jgi:hypothetical protein